MPSNEPDRPNESFTPSEDVDSVEDSFPESFKEDILSGAEGVYPGIESFDVD